MSTFKSVWVQKRVTFMPMQLFLFDSSKSDQAENILKCYDVAQAEADIFALFQRVMNDAQHMEMFRPNYTGTYTLLNQKNKSSSWEVRNLVRS